MSKTNQYPKVKQAIALDGSQQAAKTFYAEWADNYDEDTQSWQYCGCDTAYRFLQTLPQHEELNFELKNKSIRIMDVGCGTGLMGKLLHQQGYRHLDGCDLSLEMILQADSLNIYNTLTADIDINQSINPDWKDAYDLCICIGVFTPGHVEPLALNQLVDMTKPGGLVLVSTRVEYYETTDYQIISETLETQNRIKLLKVDQNQPYTDESLAHYWAYAVL